MIFREIFISAVGTHIPQRVPIGSVARTGALAGKYQWGDFESATVSDIPAHAMAGLAAKQAVERCTLSDVRLSPLIYASQGSLTAEHATPVCYLARVLDQQASPLAFELGAACDAGLMGIEVIARMLSSGDTSDAGMIATACHLRENEREAFRWNTGELFSDGAAAAIVAKNHGFAQLLTSQHTLVPELEFLQRTRMRPDGLPMMEVAEVGLGPYVDIVTEVIVGAVRTTLAEVGLSIDDMAHVCPPALARPALEEMFLCQTGIPMEKVCWAELRKNGHVGPCDQIIALAHLFETGQLKRGQYVLLLGGGLGWHFTCQVLQVI